MNITVSTPEIVRLIIETAIIIIAGWDLIFSKKRGVWYKRISKLGWIFIIVAFAGLFDSVYLLFANATEKEIEKWQYNSDRKNDKDDILNGVEKAFNKHNLSYNPVTNTITVIDSSQKVLNPVLDVVPDSTKFTGTLENAKLKIQLKTINGGIAYNARALVLLFTVKDNSLTVKMKPREAFNETSKIYGINGMTYFLPLPINKGFYYASTKDTSFIFLRVTYTNKQVNGAVQPPLRKVFFVISMKNADKVEDIKIHNFDEVNTARVDSVQRLLKVKRYW